MPPSAKGTTPNVTTGIASALAMGATSEVCANSASVSGVSPTVTTHCACVPSRSVRSARRVHVASHRELEHVLAGAGLDGGAVAADVASLHHGRVLVLVTGA